VTRRCRFRPSVCPLEGRVVLSFSFSKVLHSVFPFIHDHSKHKPTAKAHHAATVVPHTTAPHVAHAATSHPRGAFNWHGPSLHKARFS
jgi:hypothetical protein